MDFIPALILATGLDGVGVFGTYSTTVDLGWTIT